MLTERVRLMEAHNDTVPWKKWGPYFSERQWHTVRKDYSEGGNACPDQVLEEGKGA